MKELVAQLSGWKRGIMPWHESTSRLYVRHYISGDDHTTVVCYILTR